MSTDEDAVHTPAAAAVARAWFLDSHTTLLVKLRSVDISLSKTDLGPPAKALVEKLSDAIGTAWKPVDKVLNAYADVKVAKIKAQGKIAVEGARNRALERLFAEETKKQLRLETVYRQAIQSLQPGVDPATIDQLSDDWIVLHSEKARLVSDRDMQSLWAKILTREAENPGSFSKRTLEFLGTLEKSEAADFTDLCRCVVDVEGFVTPIVFGYENFHHLGNRAAVLAHLVSIGLIRMEEWSSFGIWIKPPAIQVRVSYFHESKMMEISKVQVNATGPDNLGERWVPTGRYQFTKLGLELSRIAGAESLPDFWDSLARVWSRIGIMLPS